jgi:hypothetical protein
MSRLANQGMTHLGHGDNDAGNLVGADGEEKPTTRRKAGTRPLAHLTPEGQAGEVLG